MNRTDCLDVFVRLRQGALVIVGPGLSASELFSGGHDPATIYNMDMGYSAPMCLGLALACPEQRVVAIEGDGSMLMSLGSLTTTGRYQPANLVVIVFDNGRYLTTGRGVVESATAYGMDLAALARGAGVQRAVIATDLQQFESAMTRAQHEDGPWFILARVDASDRTDSRPRRTPEEDLVEQAVLFQIALRERGITGGRTR